MTGLVASFVSSVAAVTSSCAFESGTRILCTLILRGNVSSLVVSLGVGLCVLLLYR